MNVETRASEPAAGRGEIQHVDMLIAGAGIAGNEADNFYPGYLMRGLDRMPLRCAVAKQGARAETGLSLEYRRGEAEI